MLARALAGLKQRFHPLDHIGPGGAPGAVSLWILLLILCMVLVVAGRWYAGWFSVNKRWAAHVSRLAVSNSFEPVFRRLYDAGADLARREKRGAGSALRGARRPVRSRRAGGRPQIRWRPGPVPRADAAPLAFAAGDFIRNEIDSQMTGRVLALRDDRHFDDPEDIDGNRRCADNQHLIHNYLPANCFPNEWSASIAQDSGTALAPAKVRPNVAPSQKDFAFIARRGRYYMGDWLEIDPTYAPDNSLYRLTSRVHLGKQSLEIDLVGDPVSITIGDEFRHDIVPAELKKVDRGDGHVARPAVIAIGAFKVEISVACARVPSHARDEEADAKPAPACPPAPQDGRPYAYFLKFRRRTALTQTLCWKRGRRRLFISTHSSARLRCRNSRLKPTRFGLAHIFASHAARISAMTRRITAAAWYGRLGLSPTAAPMSGLFKLQRATAWNFSIGTAT